MRRVVQRLSGDWRDSYDASANVRRLEHRNTGLWVRYAEDLELTAAGVKAVWEALCTAAYDGATGQHEIEVAQEGAEVTASVVPVIGSPFLPALASVDPWLCVGPQIEVREQVRVAHDPDGLWTAPGAPCRSW